MKRRRRSLSGEPCIYCFSTTAPKAREHVLTQALGRFKDNWILDCVCKPCNQFFGRALELALTRDSLEAFLRFEHGVNSPQTGAKLLNRRVRTKIGGTSRFRGVRVELRAPEGGRLEPDLIPQVGLRRLGGEWRYFTEREITRDVLRQYEGDGEMCLIGHESFHILRRMALLGVHIEGVAHASWTTIAPVGRLEIEQELVFDSTLRRAGAKIAVNYAAKVLGSDVVRQPGFDTIREFIRNGTEPRPLVQAKPFPALLLDTDLPGGHVLSIEWMASRAGLVAMVSLFNSITYLVSLRQGDAEVWSGVSRRHLFDLETLEVVPFEVDGDGIATRLVKSSSARSGS